jgi:hypothetical protein
MVTVTRRVFDGSPGPLVLGVGEALCPALLGVADPAFATLIMSASGRRTRRRTIPYVLLAVSLRAVRVTTSRPTRPGRARNSSACIGRSRAPRNMRRGVVRSLAPAVACQHAVEHVPFRSTFTRQKDGTRAAKMGA